VATTKVKDEAHRLIDQLSDDASWDDVAYAVYIQSKLDRKERNQATGRYGTTDEVLGRLGS
jgi:hypothetical protein